MEGGEKLLQVDGLHGGASESTYTELLDSALRLTWHRPSRAWQAKAQHLVAHRWPREPPPGPSDFAAGPAPRYLNSDARQRSIETARYTIAVKPAAT